MNTEKHKPVVLAILDGYGISERQLGNAICQAKTPNLDQLFADYAYTTLEASGLAVGLPKGQMGNSEVGHTNIGAGRVVYQELTRITKEIEDGDFYANEMLLKACSGGNLHIMGLLSDGGVHSHIYHIKALVDLAVEEGVERIFIHAFLDGRDTAPTSGEGFLWELEDYIARYENVQVATVSGRYYPMDRDKRYERVELAYQAIVKGEGEKFNLSFERVDELYTEGVTDEFVLPMVAESYTGMQNGDSVIFANFRPDRGRELSRALADPAFNEFDVTGRPSISLTTMTCYDAAMDYASVAYPAQPLENTLSQWISKCGKTQLHLSETEKYAHVTFFLAGGIEAPYEGETRVLVDSPKVATYDMEPRMSADLVTDHLIEAIGSQAYDFIVVNLANCDMVGHTGKVDATILAVEAVDQCVGRIRDAVEAVDGTLMITADHGNADCLLDEASNVCTAHSNAPVPFAMTGGMALRKGGALSDIAPTVLEMMGLAKPTEMTGESLLMK